MKCHHRLNLSVEDFILDSSQIPRMSANKTYSGLIADPKTFMQPSAYAKLKQLGEVNCLVFEQRPLADKGKIHIDIDSKTLKPYWPTLNIVIQGQGQMRWHQPEDPGIEEKITVNQNKFIVFRAWYDKFGPIIDYWSEGKIALVRTDVPHTVVNYDSVTRLLVSIRWTQSLSFEDTIQFFQDNF